MTRFSKAIVSTVAGIVLVMGFVLVTANHAQAGTRQLELYGEYFVSPDDATDAATEVADSINEGNASGWSDAYLGEGRFWKNDSDGDPIFIIPVYAYHYYD